MKTLQAAQVTNNFQIASNPVAATVASYAFKMDAARFDEFQRIFAETFFMFYNAEISAQPFRVAFSVAFSASMAQSLSAISAAVLPTAAGGDDAALMEAATLRFTRKFQQDFEFRFNAKFEKLYANTPAENRVEDGYPATFFFAFGMAFVDAFIPSLIAGMDDAGVTVTYTLA